MHIYADQNGPDKEQIADLEFVRDLYQNIYKGKKKCRILKQTEIFALKEVQKKKD